MKISDEELIRLCRDVGFKDKEWRALTYESGPYFITKPRVVFRDLVERIQNYQSHPPIKGEMST